MANQFRIDYLKSIIKSWNYNENGFPIGVEPEKYIAICEELEELENN